jgi:hypothetical protein
MKANEHFVLDDQYRRLCRHVAPSCRRWID